MLAIVSFLFGFAAAGTHTPEALAATLLTAEIRKLDGSETLCVGVDGKDAPSSLLDVLRVSTRIVVRQSECVPFIKGSHVKGTHRPATLLSVEHYRTTRDGHAEVELNVYRNGLWAIYRTLEVAQSGGAWVVVSVKRDVEA